MGLAFYLAEPSHSTVAYCISFMIGSSFTVIMLTWYIGRKGKETFTLKGVSGRTWLRVLLLSVSQYMFNLLFYGCPVWITQSGIFSGYWILTFLAVISAPVVEEILFRGLLQKQLFPKKPWLSILISSIVFAALHFRNIHGRLLTFLMSVFCGMIYYKTDKLTVSIIFHSLYNLLCLVAILHVRHIPLQLASFVLAAGIAVYTIRGFMRDKTLKQSITNKE
jgi:membrane protease YdiL (CAAX protease family)